jgi:hypothetical protein
VDPLGVGALAAESAKEADLAVEGARDNAGVVDGVESLDGVGVVVAAAAVAECGFSEFS